MYLIRIANYYFYAGQNGGLYSDNSFKVAERSIMRTRIVILLSVHATHELRLLLYLKCAVSFCKKWLLP